MKKMCGKALKTRLIFRGRTNEEHGQGLYPAAATDAAYANQPHPDHGQKKYVEGAAGIFSERDRHSIGVRFYPTAEKAAAREADAA